MATKRARKSGKKVKTLRAKSLSGKKAKGVKGGAQKVQYVMGDGSVRFVSP